MGAFRIYNKPILERHKMITFEPRVKTKTFDIDGQKYDIEFKQLTYSEIFDIDAQVGFGEKKDEFLDDESSEETKKDNSDTAEKMLLFCKLILEKSSNIKKENIENFIVYLGLVEAFVLCGKIKSFSNLDEEEKK